MNVDHDFVEKLNRMNHEDIRSIHSQYSDWSRHLHSQILTITTFGITLALASLTIFTSTDITPTQYLIVGISSLLLLTYSLIYAESVKDQQSNYWAIVDNVEYFWGIRDKGDQFNKPLIRLKDYKPGSTAIYRWFLNVVVGVIWIVAITMKFLGYI